MAIHEDVPGIEVTVRCAGQALPEYEDPDDHDNDDVAACPLGTKYIECVDDTEFDVCIRVGPAYSWGYRHHVLKVATFVDGKYVRGSLIRSKDAIHGGYAIECVEGQESRSSRTGQWSKRKFKFAMVKTVDDAQKERLEKDIKVAKGLGTIEVKFTRVLDCGPSTSDYGGWKSSSGTLELAEKSLKGKAISHGTSYGAKQYIRTPYFIHTRDLVEDNGPILILKFNYRSRDALKRELIVPRSPSHSPTFENLSQAERDRLARERLNELRDQKVKQEGKRPMIKREFGEVVDLTEDPPAPPPTKKSRLGDGREVDVVDLTDD
ncbi:hypothetical protein O1611_g2423 [Lasiodiplodia mahajangana]|uniref:Uncharacterized protein n=1 Tax=Lasiodiplodia mahajangana TaxID=1108764 RepID=A0ACC2JV39_9PEZI|nr:hypothetical protein O1611_g2423 [Lasiodiplodia mahajangana]